MGHVRVRGHDYRAKGYYFITFGTLERRSWLSRIERGKVLLEPAGELLMDAWRKIAAEDPAYELGVTAVMPDHFHGLAIARRAPKYVIGTHVSRVEGRVLHAMRKRLDDPGRKMWADGFYDYLSLDMKMLRAFENYILDNPVRWQLPHDHPASTASGRDDVDRLWRCDAAGPPLKEIAAWESRGASARATKQDRKQT
jgi:REP element-mobilizing transposase RayT